MLTLSYLAVMPLTRKALGSSLELQPMTATIPTFFGLSTSELALAAQHATEDAIAANAKAGISVTGLVDGKVQTLAPTDPRIQAVIARQEQRAAGVINAYGR